MIDRSHELPLAGQGSALGISRGSVCNLARPASDADLAFAIVTRTNGATRLAVCLVVNRSEFAGGCFVWVLCRQAGLLKLAVEVGFGLGGRDMPDGFEQAAVVEPVHPFERGELDGLEVAPRAGASDHLGLEETVDGLGEGVEAPMSVKRLWKRARSWAVQHKVGGRSRGRCSVSGIA